MYSVKLEIFEGPLDLLLHLVDKNQLDITEISLSKISRGYEDYLIKLQELNLEIESSFIVVFATLLEIKSKMLLPKAPPSGEEEEEEPTEHELVRRLKEYRQFKRVAEEMEEMAEEASHCFCRADKAEIAADSPVLFTQFSPEDLMDIYISVLRKMHNQKPESFVEMEGEKISFPLILKMISNRIKSRLSASLQDLFDDPPTRIQFIVTFLVLLEMAKRKKISLMQEPGEETITIINCKEARKMEKLEIAG